MEVNEKWLKSNVVLGGGGISFKKTLQGNLQLCFRARQAWVGITAPQAGRPRYLNALNLFPRL